MIQDIFPHQMKNQYVQKSPGEKDKILYFQENQVLIQRNEEQELCLPNYGQLHQYLNNIELIYLFSIDEESYFLMQEESFLTHKKSEQENTLNFAQIPTMKGYGFEVVRSLRQLTSKEVCFATMTAWHLSIWYGDNHFCGRCGIKTVHDQKERMLRCPDCGNMIFPKIAPAVIVCVTDGDRILMSRYADREYKKYALLAGFTEIGETAEETVAREVMEEVGLRVKNIRYYKSQPFGFDSNLLLGFFCELDGDDKITIDTEELATAEWFNRDEMPGHDDGISLTGEMMGLFERNEFY